ncbi:hypothetical protein Hanom_Chr17g01571821 [Helianthus anomalus]
MNAFLGTQLFPTNDISCSTQFLTSNLFFELLTKTQPDRSNSQTWLSFLSDNTAEPTKGPV